MKYLLLIILYIPFHSYCQNDLGRTSKIDFNTTLNWQQIKQKAKKENKLIFLDVFTTWCGPCKTMDHEVYSNDSVGSFFNIHFISVKVQMDTSAKDDTYIKSWYSDAHKMLNEYKITGYPTFLFINPNGQIIFRGLGYMPSADFLMFSKKSLLPENLIYFSALENYKAGKLPKSIDLYGLAKYAASIGDTKIASQIAQKYISTVDKQKLLSLEKLLFVLNIGKDKKLADSLAIQFKTSFLNKLTFEELAQKQYLEFGRYFQNTLRSDDKIFQFAYNDPDRTDNILNYHYAKMLVLITVRNEDILGYVLKDNKPVFAEPDWRTIISRLHTKYPKIDFLNQEGDMITRSKLMYYKTIKDWKNYTKIIVDRVNTMGAFSLAEGLEGNIISNTDLYLNNLAYTVFLYSYDKTELERALSWSNVSIAIANINIFNSIDAWNSTKANWMDTKANLLYKLGRNKEAVELETEIIELDNKNKEFQANLQKMKAGLPTWPALN